MKTFLLTVGFFLMLFLPLQASAEIRFNLENPADGEPAAGISMISGWAFCTSGVMSYVEGFVNGSSIGLLPFGYGRMDVANANPGIISASSSGFGMEINWGNIPPGIYTLKITFTCVSGEKASIQRNIKTVRYGDAAFVDNFDLTNATANLDKSTNPPQLVITNVRIRNAETGEWKTIILRFQFSIGLQSFILTSASMVGGDPAAVSYVFDAEADKQIIQAGVDAGSVFANQELAMLNAILMPFTVYGAGNLDNFVQMYCQAYNPQCQPDVVRKSWENLGGMAAYGSVFFYTGGVGWNQIPDDRAKKTSVVHEIYHEAQNTLAGSPGIVFNTPPNQVPRGGPQWLIEGSAVLAQIRWQGAQPPEFAFEDYKNFLLANRLIGRSCDLATIETRDGMVAVGTDIAYACGMLAAEHLLYTTPNLLTLLVFWQNIGQGQAWETAFKNSFKRDKNTFYTEFASYRASLG